MNQIDDSNRSIIVPSKIQESRAKADAECSDDMPFN